MIDQETIPEGLPATHDAPGYNSTRRVFHKQFDHPGSPKKKGKVPHQGGYD